MRVLKLNHLPISNVPHLPASLIGLNVNNTTIIHHIPTQIRSFFGKQQQRIYLTKHHQWSSSTFDTIHWDQFRSIYFAHRLNKRRFITKWINKILPFNQRHYLWNLAHSPRCPSCSHDKDETHFLRCPNRARQKHQSTLPPLLTTIFQKHNINPTIQKIVLFFTSKNNKATNSITNELCNTRYIDAFQNQNNIATDSLFFGFHSNLWVPL